MSATYLVEDTQVAKKVKFSRTNDSNVQKQLFSKIQIAELMVEKREEGLSKRIGEENKGFALLKKLGFQEEKGLGATETGLLVPLEIREHRSRSGIGSQNVVNNKRDAKRMKKLELESVFEVAEEGFKESSREKRRYKEQIRNIKKAEKVISELDCCLGIARHDLWPAEDLSDMQDGGNAGQDSSDDFRQDSELPSEAVAVVEDNQRLDACVEYLRDVHCYCLFCGCRYENEADLSQNCPGKDEDDH